MGDKTKIEWAESSFNPIRARNIETDKIGWYCQRVSGGCLNCYAATMNGRLGTGVDYAVDQFNKVELFLDEKILQQPLRWKRSRRVFVCSMTDLFADFVPFEWIDKIFAVMALCGQHDFQVLTKRPERMREYMARLSKSINPLENAARSMGQTFKFEWDSKTHSLLSWPIRNVWLGVSVEDQKTADQRIPILLQTPAAVRWVSYEPAISPVNFAASVFAERTAGSNIEKPRLNWIVVGGESGPRARPFNVEWARDTVKQCGAAGVPCFVKQMGSCLTGINLEGPPYSSPPRREGFLVHWTSNETNTFGLCDRKGGDWSEWPDDLRVREYPRNRVKV